MLDEGILSVSWRLTYRRSNSMTYINLGGKICGEVPDEVARSIIEEIRAAEKPD